MEASVPASADIPLEIHAAAGGDRGPGCIKRSTFRAFPKNLLSISFLKNHTLDLVPEDAYPDPSQFIDFPLLPVPEVKGDGHPVAAILDTFTEYSLRHEVNLLLMSPKHWRAQLEKARPSYYCLSSRPGGAITVGGEIGLSATKMSRTIP